VRKTTIALTAMIWSLQAGQAQAQVLPIVGGGILIDKAGSEFRESVDYAKAAAFALMDRADQLAMNRLNQIDLILRKTVGDLIGKTEQSALLILSKAKKDIDDIRVATFADLRRVIWEAECAGKRTVLGDLKEALGGLGEVLRTHQIKLTAPIPANVDKAWYCSILSCDDRIVIQIQEPFGDTYIAVRDAMEASIAPSRVEEETPVHRIVGTYEYLSAFALKTSCFYPGSSETWNEQYVEYQQRARQWRNILKITLR
jgi:hypothetical protein